MLSNKHEQTYKRRCCPHHQIDQNPQKAPFAISDFCDLNKKNCKDAYQFFYIFNGLGGNTKNWMSQNSYVIKCMNRSSKTYETHCKATELLFTCKLSCDSKEGYVAVLNCPVAEKK